MILFDPGRLLDICLDCVGREFPYYLQHTFDRPTHLRRPSDLHPAFFGCYDWHSAVHNHWLLVRLQREFPELEKSAAARAVLDAHLAPAPLAAELRYLMRPDSTTFSRPYGWAWFLRLHAEAASSPGASARRWTTAMTGMRDTLADRLRHYFTTDLQFPIRSGLHGNSAFSLTLALDAARAINDVHLEQDLRAAGRRLFLDDHDYPTALEPQGEDFLSPALSQAAALATILHLDEFAGWLTRFLPALADNAETSLLDPPVYEANAADPATVHLDGLVLTKAWALCRILQGLPPEDQRRAVLARSARRHLTSASRALDDRQYLATHWVPTFIALAHIAATQSGIVPA